MSETTPSPEAERPVDPWLVERLLADPAAAGDRDEQALAILLAALRSPASADELEDRDRYLAAFASAQTLRLSPPLSRRKSMLASFLAAKTAVAGFALVTATATAAAAYTGSLPSTLQEVAHRSIGAPAADPSHPAPAPSGRKAGPAATPTPTGTPSPTASPKRGRGPDLNGPAAVGLCKAFAKGGLRSTSTSGRALAEAAGGAGKIPAFCAKVRKDDKRPDRPAGKPSSRPTGQPTASAGDQPNTHPTGKPGQPSATPEGR